MYKEPEYIKLIFLLADIQSWVDTIAKQAFMLLPVKDKNKLQKKTYFLSVKAMAHILEKHYYKINRYPQSGKFTIPVTSIVEKIQAAKEQIPAPIRGSLNYKRVMLSAETIGFNRDGILVKEYTVLTDAAGDIVTAFPGTIQEHNSS